MSLEKGYKKLVLVSITSTLVTTTRKEAVETAKTIKTARTDKNSKENKDSEYLRNLIQVLCIQYSITFQKKFVPVLALFKSGSKVNAIYSTFA